MSMQLDVKQISAVKNELTAKILNMRIEKVEQPERDIIILTLRGKDSNAQRLLICVNSNDVRVHLTQHKLKNPQSPPCH